ncbi:MAG: hypothetical protein OXT67_02405 [Zetaproteobacteria bacterium]|nr:hypothetical protein [Zetaproteobacteria bacterium]
MNGRTRYKKFFLHCGIHLGLFLTLSSPATSFPRWSWGKTLVTFSISYLTHLSQFPQAAVLPQLHDSLTNTTQAKGELLSLSERHPVVQPCTPTCTTYQTYTTHDWFDCYSPITQLYLKENFATAFPQGLLIPIPGKQPLLLTSAEDLYQILPHMSTDLTQRQHTRELIAALLNIQFDRCTQEGTCMPICTYCHGDTLLAEQTLQYGPCKGTTVEDVIGNALCILSEDSPCNDPNAEKSALCLRIINRSHRNILEKDKRLFCPNNL